jgi:hypothetical protein
VFLLAAASVNLNFSRVNALGSSDSVVFENAKVPVLNLHSTWRKYTINSNNGAYLVTELQRHPPVHLGSALGPGSDAQLTALARRHAVW